MLPSKEGGMGRAYTASGQSGMPSDLPLVPAAASPEPYQVTAQGTASVVCALVAKRERL